MTVLNSILQRQLICKQPKSRIPLDFAVKSFCCHRVDEHIVRGRDEEMEVPPFASQFSKSKLGGHLLATADEDGSVKLFDTRKYGHRSIIKEWTAHSNAIFDIAWMEGEAKLVTASGDQTAQLWDVELEKCLSVFRGHSCSLKSVNFRENDIYTFCTGARDGNIMVWDIRCNVPVRDSFYRPVITIRNAHTLQSSTLQRVKKRSRGARAVFAFRDSQQSVTAVVFQDENKLISTGAMDGKIKIWDLRKNYSNVRCYPVPCHLFPYPGSEPRTHGFSSLVLDSNQSKLFASCTNDKIYMYECTVLKEHPVCSFSGHKNTTFYVKSALSPDDSYLLSGSSDNDAYIWRINQPQSAPFILKGHEGEITSVAWCPVDLGKLVTCSDDNNIRIWRINCNQDAREKTDFIGQCEQSKPRPCSSPQTPGLYSPFPLCNNTPSAASLGQPTPLSTPDQTIRGRQLKTFPCTMVWKESPAQGIITEHKTVIGTSQTKFPFDGVQEKHGITQGSCRTLIIQPPSPSHALSPAPMSPASTPDRRKQVSLKAWIKTTHKKSLKENITPDSSGIKVTSVLTKNLRLKPESKFNGQLEGKGNKENSKEIETKNCFSYHMECSSRSPDYRDLSPARKRRCIGGPSSFNDNLQNSSQLNKNVRYSYVIDEETKENVDAVHLNTCTQESDEKSTDSGDNRGITASNTWVIKWKNRYLTCKKTNGEAMGEPDEQTTCEEIPKLVPAGESILKYFKPISSPIKENK